MATFADVFKGLRLSNGYTQDELAKKLNFSKSRVNMYERGEREPNFEALEIISDFFNVDMNYLLGKTNKTTKVLPGVDLDDYAVFDNVYPIEVKRFPLLGEIACGEPIYANEDRESYVMAGTDIDADFCLKAKGDSMIGARILDGDIVFIKETDIVDNGEIAAVIIDDEVLLKRFDYSKEENILALHSENPMYKTMRFSGEELNHIRVLGKAVAFQSDIF